MIIDMEGGEMMVQVTTRRLSMTVEVAVEEASK
jgi:hypothetical protein